MERVIVDIADMSKAEILLKFLSQLDFIKIRRERRNDKKAKSGSFAELFGIWKKRDITIGSIREQAWHRAAH